MTTIFPSHTIDPKKKNKEWCLQFAQAAWSNWKNLATRREDYRLLDDYAQGRQSIDQYKPVMGVNEAGESWNSLDFTVLPIIPKLLTQATSRLNKAGYNIVATAIDPLAQRELSDYFKDLQAKIKIRQELEKIVPGFSEYTPAAKMKPGEPEDLEELELQQNWTYQHQATIEIEQALDVIFNHNNYWHTRKLCKEDILTYGIGGVKEYVDSNGSIKIRRIKMQGFISSYCEQRDFSDAEYLGEVIELTIADLKQLAQGQFTEEEYEQIANMCKGRYGNPNIYPQHTRLSYGYDNFKVQVLDLEFFSVNEDYYERSENNYGNVVISGAPYGSKSTQTKEYLRTSYKVVYKAMYIVDSKFIFNYGLCTDMKRAKDALNDTTMSFHVYAPDMRNMRITSKVGQVMPLADQIQIAWLKLQQAIAEARPKGIQIELGGLEDINYGQGGKKLMPHEVMELFFQKGVLIYRKADTQGRETNYRPIEELGNGLGDAAVQWYNTILNHLQLMRDIFGLNEFTDGSSPDPRTLSLVAQMANEGTNNALYPVIEADEHILRSLSSALVLRMSSVVKRHPIEGYTTALGQNTMRFFKLSKDISNYEFGIKLENKPTDEQRAEAFAMAQTLAGQGMLELEDFFTIQNTSNLKVAQQIIAYKVRKRQEQKQKEALQMQEANAQVQMQSAAATADQERQTMQMKYQFEMQLEQLKGEYMLKAAMARAEATIGAAQIGGEAKTASTVLQQATAIGAANSEQMAGAV